MLKGLVALGVGSVAATEVGTAATARWTVTSPDGELEADVMQDSNGRLSLSISHDDSRVLEPSPLGIESSVAGFVTGLTFQGRTDRRIDDTYRTIRGPSNQYRHQAHQATFAFTAETGRSVELDVRVANEGVTYRYRIPGDGPVRMTGEENAFQIPSDPDAWLMPYPDGYENIWRETTATSSPRPTSSAAATRRCRSTSTSPAWTCFDSRHCRTARSVTTTRLSHRTGTRITGHRRTARSHRRDGPGNAVSLFSRDRRRSIRPR